MLNQLRQIAIFSKTIEHGSFRKAAVALKLSPSVVSHHIAKLEEELGVALLYRSTRKLSLTSDGEALLVSAREMIDAAEDFLNVATKQTTQLIGDLNISLPAVLERSAIVNYIGDFSKLHPGVNLKLGFTDTQIDIIKDGVDVAIRMGWLQDSGLRAIKLYEVNRIVVASTSYVNSKAKKISLEEIENWDWIELASIGLNNIFFYPEGSNKVFRPKSKIRVNSAYAIHKLVRNDNGIAALPKFLAKNDIADGKLVHVLPEIKMKPIGVHAVWPPNAPKGGLTNRLVNHLKESLVEIP